MENNVDTYEFPKMQELASATYGSNRIVLRATQSTNYEFIKRAVLWLQKWSDPAYDQANISHETF